MRPAVPNHPSVHNHGPVFSETKTSSEEFSFHPSLISWLKDPLRLTGNEILTLTEIGCTDNSCPVIETCLEVFTDSKTTSPRHRIRFGRAKHLISKMDLAFSLKKQGIVE
ncbi:hypothetical protein EHQ12_10595 [Leptospira gomenensis]|uniref:Uncharacterized protein n=1 Tax=Leptospira gomenensis TaxID=2484974 RepID=A0A5F1Y585_9LEPT|nr:hypothetical protein [Leptospira gomenensis]TGK27573.1 hypothetical protein EHQ17_19605 [Leptospira gomenensis]TGK38215.1 hypothetical protein EHQ12_10595 [Leptospira gomenensis]TGK42655.1 hypothetical protein EHQ07_14705 [Leptospira gomenensis]TGK65818.1 hypothetical protein EHQ13_04810 [Leptospira gomenensis]